jgi:hypothetical protein
VDVSRQTEIFGLERFVCGGVGEDGLGVNTGFVCEGTETSDGLFVPRAPLSAETQKVL